MPSVGPSVYEVSAAALERLRANWGRVLIIASAGVVSHVFGRGTVSVLLPAMADDLGLTEQVAASLASVNLAGYLIGTVAILLAAGRFEPFTLLRAGVVVVAVGLAVLSVATTTPMVMVGVGLGGLGGPGIWMTAPALVTEVVPPDRRGVAMGSLTALMGAGFIVVSLVTDAARHLLDNSELWRPVWLGELATTVVLLALIAGFVKTPPTERLAAGSQWKALRHLVGRNRTLVAYMGFAWTASAFPVLLGLAVEHHHGLSRSFATLLFSALGVASMIGALALGRLSDALGRPTTMALVMAAVALAGVIFPLFANELVITVIVIVYGGALFSYPALTAAYVREHVADRLFTSAFATLTLYYSVVTAISPIVSGALVTGSPEGGDTNYTAPYFTIAAMAAGAALLMGSVALSGARGPARTGAPAKDTPAKEVMAPSGSAPDG